jgi:predicted GIY-YIG superfamily endonuclease
MTQSQIRRYHYMPKFFKMIWLLQNTTITNKHIQKLTGIHHTDIGRINKSPNALKGIQGLEFPLRKIDSIPKLDSRKLTTEQQNAYQLFVQQELPQLVQQYRINNLQVAGVYIVERKGHPEDCYIGCSQDISKRWKSHTKNIVKSYKYQEALQTYGRDAFEIRILEYVPDSQATKQVLYFKEGDWIRKLNPSYNINSGARSFWILNQQLEKVYLATSLRDGAIFLATDPLNNSNLSSVLKGKLVSVKSHYLVYTNEYTEDWQPPRDGRLKGVKHA